MQVDLDSLSQVDLDPELLFSQKSLLNAKDNPDSQISIPLSLLDDSKDIQLPSSFCLDSVVEEKNDFGDETFRNLFEETLLEDFDEDFLIKVLESSQKQSQSESQIVADQVAQVAAIEKQKDIEDTENFMKTYLANQQTSKILGKADQQLIYGNVGLKGTPPNEKELE